LPDKLKAIRARTRLSPDEFAARVGAQSGAEILSYENDEGELPVSVLHHYAKVFDIPLANIVDDTRDLWFGDRQN
jgi:transcriptional regulator with XRE-family HTH domain